MITVETIRFHLRQSVQASDFRQVNHLVETQYMERRPGFRSRETLLRADGEWLVIVHWASAQDAEATINAFFGAPETQDFIAAVDTTTVASDRYELVGN